MIPNNNDLKVLKVLFYSTEPQTIYSIAKSLYPGLTSSKEISKKSSPIRQSINKLDYENLIFEDEIDKKKTYTLNREFSKFSKTATITANSKRYKLTDIILIKIKDEWEFYQIAY